MKTRVGVSVTCRGQRSRWPGVGVKVTVIESLVVGLAGETAIVPYDCAEAENGMQRTAIVMTRPISGNLIGPNA